MSVSFKLKTKDEVLPAIFVGLDIDQATGIKRYYGMGTDHAGNRFGGMNATVIGTGGKDSADADIDLNATIDEFKIGTASMDDVNEGLRIYLTDSVGANFAPFVTMNLEILKDAAPRRVYELQVKTDVGGDSFYGFMPGDLLQYTAEFIDLFAKNLNNQITIDLTCYISV